PKSAVQPAPARQAARGPGIPDDARQKLLQRSEERVKALIREYEDKDNAFLKSIREAKTTEKRKAVQTRRVDPAFYAGALLQEAEINPGTPPDEEALIWIVSHLVYGSMAERATEVIARDHIRSDKLEALFTRNILINMTGSKATERLFREALAKNPNRR